MCHRVVVFCCKSLGGRAIMSDSFFLRLAIVLAIGAALSFSAAQQAAVTVTITPNYKAILPGQKIQFSAAVGGGGNPGVTWQVNNIVGGSSAVGTITKKGRFTAPATIPSPAIVNVTAVSQAQPTVSATATLTMMAQGASGSTYYVASTGSDNNNGSLSAPWQHIQYAANQAHAGDTVYARGGIYNELVSFPASGSAAAGFITFSSYPGELATLDGTGLSIPGGQWGLVTIVDQSYLVINGFEVRNYKTDSRADVPIGIYVSGAGTNVQIVNNHIHDIVTTATGCGANAFGLTVYGTKAPDSINNIAISGNELDNLVLGCSETLSLDGNVTNFAVTSNVVHDSNNIAIGAIGFEKVSPQVAYDQARNGEIRGNTVYNISSYGNPAYGKQYAADGIYVDGGTLITIEQNLIHNVDLGIELASEHHNKNTTYVTARNNVIYDGNSAGISIGGYAGGVGGTQNCTVVNNTLFGNDTKKTGSGEFQIQFHASNNVFENNILYSTSQGLLMNGFVKSQTIPATIDYNLYYSTVGEGSASWNYQGKTYQGFANYLAQTGNDKHSPAFSDPLFMATDGTNFDLQSGSPASAVGIDLGADIAGNVDFNGNPRIRNGLINLGAYEQ